MIGFSKKKSIGIALSFTNQDNLHIPNEIWQRIAKALDSVLESESENEDFLIRWYGHDEMKQKIAECTYQHIDLHVKEVQRAKNKREAEAQRREQMERELEERKIREQEEKERKEAERIQELKDLAEEEKRKAREEEERKKKLEEAKKLGFL